MMGGKGNKGREDAGTEDELIMEETKATELPRSSCSARERKTC